MQALYEVQTADGKVDAIHVAVEDLAEAERGKLRLVAHPLVRRAQLLGLFETVQAARL